MGTERVQINQIGDGDQGVNESTVARSQEHEELLDNVKTSLGQLSQGQLEHVQALIRGMQKELNG